MADCSPAPSQLLFVRHPVNINTEHRTAKPGTAMLIRDIGADDIEIAIKVGITYLVILILIINYYYLYRQILLNY